MLARLEAIPGVSAARVEATGRFFWLELAPGADAERVVALAGTALAGRGRLLPPADAAAQLAARERGDPWLRGAEVQALSLVEARVLSVRLSGEVARRVGAGADQREVLAEAIRVELFAAMDRVHAEGGRASGGWIHEEWPAIAAAAARRCAAALPDELLRGVAEALPAALARGP